jgi:hypothetical protein
MTESVIYLINLTSRHVSLPTLTVIIGIPFIYEILKKNPQKLKLTEEIVFNHKIKTKIFRQKFMVIQENSFIYEAEILFFF